MATNRKFLWPPPFPGFDYLLEKLTGLRKILTVTRSLYNKGYHNGHSRTVRWRGTYSEVWKSSGHRRFCPFGVGICLLGTWICSQFGSSLNSKLWDFNGGFIALAWSISSSPVFLPHLKGWGWSCKFHTSTYGLIFGDQLPTWSYLGTHLESPP